MPQTNPPVVPARARRAMPLRATLALIVLALATVLGASLAVGRAPVPAAGVDPLELTRIVPVEIPPTAQGVPGPSVAPVALDPIPDFLPRDRSFAPRPEPAQPQSVGVIIKPTPTPRPTPRPRVASGGGATSTGGGGGATSTGGGGGNSVSGTASWYCLSGVSACHYQYSGGMYAAAGPALRVGSWRGRTVRVCSGGRCVNVKLIDWCQCYGTRVIDLYSDAFRRLGSLNSGTIRVTVSW